MEGGAYINAKPIGWWGICNNVQDKFTDVLDISEHESSFTLGRENVHVNSYCVASFDDFRIRVHESWSTCL